MLRWVREGFLDMCRLDAFAIERCWWMILAAHIGKAPPLNPARRALADQMNEFWTAFVTSGSPQAAGQPDWP